MAELRALLGGTVTTRLTEADKTFNDLLEAEKANLVYTTQGLHTQIQ